MTDRREAVARAIENRFAIRLDSETGDDERDYEEVVLEAADAAIAAMGLPTRDAVEAAIENACGALMNAREFAHEPSNPPFTYRRQERLNSEFHAARQRLLDLIPMTEVNDER
jgi:hypothetical protein